LSTGVAPSTDLKPSTCVRDPWPAWIPTTSPGAGPSKSQRPTTPGDAAFAATPARNGSPNAVVSVASSAQMSMLGPLPGAAALDCGEAVGASVGADLSSLADRLHDHTAATIANAARVLFISRD